MKYYTKEWYELMQRTDYTLCMKAVKDKPYTDADIKALYNRDLKKELAEAEADHNTPPSFDVADFSDENFDLEDWATYDPLTNSLKKPASKEELVRELEEERLRAEAEFASRPPFDPQEIRDNFELRYSNGIAFADAQYPAWVLGETDRRLIALGRLPKSVFERLKAEEKRNKKEFNRICREASRELAKHSKKLPEKFREFGYHDGGVIALEKRGSDVVMLVCEDGACFEGDTPYVRVTFIDGEFADPTDDIAFGRNAEGGFEYYNCSYLYDEIYVLSDGRYEIHMLLASDGLKYATVRCRDITIERNIARPLEEK